MPFSVHKCYVAIGHRELGNRCHAGLLYCYSLLFYLIVLASLEDEHILRLSKRITDGNELEELGITVLGLLEFEIRSAKYNKKKDGIQATAYELLSMWRKQQHSRQEAYMNLHAALKRAQMNELASNLRIWVEGPGVIPQIMNESK